MNVNQQKYILAAVDGTLSSSAGYRGANGGNLSYVRQFAHDLNTNGGIAKFWDGPETQSGATGWDAYPIFLEVFDWVWRQMMAAPEAKLVLVGHSRGGHIVANVARRLRTVAADIFHRGAYAKAKAKTLSDIYAGLDHPGVTIDPITYLAEAIDHRLYDGVPIQFLGLYDAVDMTTSLGDTSVVPKNVHFCYHALRSSELGSRRLWGNTAMSVESEASTVLMKSEFRATHGSVGGAVPAGCSQLTGVTGFVDEYGPMAAGVPMVDNPVQYVASTLPTDTCLADISAAENHREGEKANAFVRRGARLAGLRFH